MGSFWVSWAVLRVRREGGSLMRMAMHWFLIEPKLSVVPILLIQGEGLSLPCLDDPPQGHLVDC